MFGKKLLDINTYKSFYREKKSFTKIYSNSDFFFYRFNSTGNFQINVVSYFLSIDSQNPKIIKLYKVNANDIFYFKSNLKYFFFSNKKISLKKINTLINNEHKSLKILNTKTKYWGQIITLFNNKKFNLAAKVIFMNKNTQSSLEYHLNKTEAYYIELGMIHLGLRYGRAKQSIIKLSAKSSFFMSRGIMHMRISKKDSMIVEISTFDEDSDSYIVEDGKKFNFQLR